MKRYLVGGAVRDNLMGIPSKDADFSVVLEPTDMSVHSNSPFQAMVNKLKAEGFKIFLETPEHLTVRAQFPKGDNSFGTRDADFVLARKEGTYTDGRRPDSVEIGTLADDIRRRDFTMNALAKAENGEIIDLVGGVADINAGMLRAVGDPVDRLTEDALRAVRAMRFAVTKSFDIELGLMQAMQHGRVLDSVENKISDERIAVELSKMFRFDTLASLEVLSVFPLLTRAMFAGTVSLDSTMKTRGRGK